MGNQGDEFAEASFVLPPPEADDHAGHRQRVRERFLRVGGEAMEDYEILELALQLVVPRRDTKALAKTLLREFGSFSGVFNASEARLGQIKGLGPTTIAHLKVIQAVAARFGRAVYSDEDAETRRTACRILRADRDQLDRLHLRCGYGSTCAGIARLLPHATVKRAARRRALA